jgi:hypothetical protein
LSCIHYACTAGAVHPACTRPLRNALRRGPSGSYTGCADGRKGGGIMSLPAGALSLAAKIFCQDANLKTHNKSRDALLGSVSWAGAPTPRAAELEVAALH